MGYVAKNYKPDDNDLVVEFLVEAGEGLSLDESAENVAKESSIGTWSELAGLTPDIKKRLQPHAFEIKKNSVKIAYPQDLFEAGSIPQMMSAIAGNIFGMKAVKNLRLQNFTLPPSMVKPFSGPAFGIQGIRKIVKVKDRPLVGTIVKPKVGFNEKEHAKVAYESWVGGLDLVKDDENLTSMKFNKFEKRIIETLKLRDKAEKETGEKKLYVANVTAETEEMIKRAEFVRDNGGRVAMVDIISTGWSAVQTLRNQDLKLIIHGHRAGHAALDRNPKHGISMLVIAKIARLIGIDQLHIGTADIGKMSQDDDVIALEDVLRDDLYHIKPSFPIASGGLHPGMIPKLVERMGKDIICQMGGGCHGHPDGTKAGAMTIRQSLEATMKGIPLEEYAEEHKELRVALDKWGVV